MFFTFIIHFSKWILQIGNTVIIVGNTGANLGNEQRKKNVIQTFWGTPIQKQYDLLFCQNGSSRVKFSVLYLILQFLKIVRKP